VSAAYHEDMQGGDFYSCTKCHQLHTAVTLLPGKETSVSIEEKVGWAPEAIWIFWRRNKISCPLPDFQPWIA